MARPRGTLSLDNGEPVQRVSSRPKRTPIGKRDRLNLKNQDPNYHYHIVNIGTPDKPQYDRLDRLLDHGYAVEAKDGTTVGDARVDNPSSLGSAKTVSLGRGDQGIVVKTKKDDFLEEQDLKVAETQIDEKERSSSARANNADYGKVDYTYPNR